MVESYVEYLPASMLKTIIIIIKNNEKLTIGYKEVVIFGIMKKE